MVPVHNRQANRGNLNTYTYAWTCNIYFGQTFNPTDIRLRLKQGSDTSKEC